MYWESTFETPRSLRRRKEADDHLPMQRNQRSRDPQGGSRRREQSQRCRSRLHGWDGLWRLRAGDPHLAERDFECDIERGFERERAKRMAWFAKRRGER